MKPNNSPLPAFLLFFAICLFTSCTAPLDVRDAIADDTPLTSHSNPSSKAYADFVNVVRFPVLVAFESLVVASYFVPAY